MPENKQTRLEKLEAVLHAIRMIDKTIQEINKKLRSEHNAQRRKKLIRRRNQLRRERLRLQRLRDDLLLRRGTISMPSNATLGQIKSLAKDVEAPSGGPTATALSGDVGENALKLAKSID